MIHNSSIISSKAKIHKNVNIGPFCIIGDHVIIEEGTQLISHIHISGNTTIGKNNKIYPFTTIGLDPQDKKYSGEISCATSSSVTDGPVMNISSLSLTKFTSSTNPFSNLNLGFQSVTLQF